MNHRIAMARLLGNDFNDDADVKWPYWPFHNGSIFPAKGHNNLGGRESTSCWNWPCQYMI